MVGVTVVVGGGVEGGDYMIVHWKYGRVVTALILGAWEGGDCMIVHWEYGRVVTA